MVILVHSLHVIEIPYSFAIFVNSHESWKFVVLDLSRISWLSSFLRLAHSILHTQLNVGYIVYSTYCKHCILNLLLSKKIALLAILHTQLIVNIAYLTYCWVRKLPPNPPPLLQYWDLKEKRLWCWYSEQKICGVFNRQLSQLIQLDSRMSRKRDSHFLSFGQIAENEDKECYSKKISWTELACMLTKTIRPLSSELRFFTGCSVTYLNSN